MSRLAVHPVRALKDNYVYLLVDEERRAAVAVDPGEPGPVNEELVRLGVTLAAIWNTHHHWDHTGGNQELARRHGGIEIVASEPDRGRVPGQTRGVADGERWSWAGEEVEAMLIPGHTLGHVAYRVGANVFPGDTLFGACCGRLFEGTPEMMVRSLGRLRALPDETKVWCGHEYTFGCLRFAITVEPDNAALQARLARVAAEPEAWTVPLSLVEERATNPFLRWDAPAVRAWAGTDDDVAAFAAVRRAKDGWKG
jgi:hydroxyacylglutathione hydrolase